MTDERHPHGVYRTGTEPDARFTLANERTFLAWLRTALALLAGGVGVYALAPQLGRGRVPLAIGFLVFGGVVAGQAYLRWWRTERAMRMGEPLPRNGFAAVFAIAVAVAAVALIVVLLT